MLTKVSAYNTMSSLDPLVFTIVDRPETDIFEIRNIDGLEAVKADVNTTPYGTIDGESYLGSNVGKRNLVLTIGLDADWVEWTPSTLRRELDKYFMPKTPVRLVFETTEFTPVEISGYVESNNPNIFSKDPENQVSIICPSPDFISVDPITRNSNTAAAPIVIDYKGTIETGFVVLLTHSVAPDPANVTIHRTNPEEEIFSIISTGLDLSGAHSFFMSSISGQKQVKIAGGIEDNLLRFLTNDSVWLTLRPGQNTVRIVTDAGTQNWSLTYYEHLGSL